MRFKVAKSDLEAALQVVNASLAGTGSDITTHYVFRRNGPDGDGKYGIEVLTYSGQIFSSCPLIVSVEDPGDKTGFTVEGWRLKHWLQYIPEDSVPEFTLDDGEVTVRVKRGKQTFQSLDPSSFPYWDKTLAESEVKARVPADRLSAALGYSKLFAMDKGTKQPEMCVCEVHDGILYSSDKKAATLIRITGMEKSEMRVHSKDVSGFQAFLATAGDGEVEVLEHDRMVLVRRGDGAMFGESRFHYAFPIPKVSMDSTDQHEWSIPRVDLQQAVGFLEAGAGKDDNRLRFAPGENPGEVIVSMANTNGRATDQVLEGVTMASDPKAPEIPEEGFVVDRLILAKTLAPWKDADVIKFGLNITGDRGFIRLTREQHESQYLTVIPWLR